MYLLSDMRKERNGTDILVFDGFGIALFFIFLHDLPQKRVYFSEFHVTNKRGIKCILRSFYFNQWHKLYFHSRILSILKQREEF